MSNTNLSNEYFNLVNEAKITLEDINKMNKTAINAAFLTEEEKKELLEKYWEE